MAGGVAVFFVGPGVLAVFAPFGMLLARGVRSAVIASSVIVAAAFITPHFQSLPDFSGRVLHAGSGAFLFVPVVTAAIVGFRALRLPGLTVLFLLPCLSFFAIDAAAYGGWIGGGELTNPIFRFVLGLFPVVTVAFMGQLLPKDHLWRDGFLWLMGASIGATVFFILPSHPISSFVFDESHGKWETTTASFQPDDFGRASNYTYSLLSNYAEGLTGETAIFEDEDANLPGTESVFVLKMPTKQLGKRFTDRLELWVKKGGRLLVVADHTDLYDTAQNLNPLLSRIGFRIGSNAVYDQEGMPDNPTTSVSMAAFGRIDANGNPLPWQTGASLTALPAGALVLTSYGPSFSEPGNYSRQNRFGPFAPRPSLRFGEHSSVIAVSFGKGAVAVVLDSTPWSNFSLFKEEYRHLFRGVIHALSMPETIRLAGWGGLAMLLTALLCTLIKGRFPLIVTGLVLGVVLGSSARIGATSFEIPIEGRDYGLKVVAGKTARLEFLKQLVAPGERNFSRIVSSTAKYGFMPSARFSGKETPDLAKAKRWLLIQPDPKQLPEIDDVFDHLRRGGDLTVFFAPEAAVSEEVSDWLSGMGLLLVRSVGLAVGESRRSFGDGLMARDSAYLMRDVRTVTAPVPSSILKEHGGNALTQSYTIRPTKFPRTSGLLNVGFSSDQFSDTAIGDVWEGIEPSSLGRLREGQLAAILKGDKPPRPFPDNLLMAPPDPAAFNSISSYLVLRDGKQVLKGTLSKAVAPDGLRSPSPSENAIAYLADLKARAVSFIKVSCPKDGRMTKCQSRLLGIDMVEWMVSWTAKHEGDIAAIELLHERRFSGLGSTWNILFGD